MNYSDFSSERCKGCGLCQNICPVNCIVLKYDEEGFLNPVRDISRCIYCGRCMNECIINCNQLVHSGDYNLYCAQSKDTENLRTSSSGGLFGELATLIIEGYKGVVYGAVYENVYRVRHARAENMRETLPMHYSKYVQSDTSGIYKEVKKDLETDRTVLFTGTPCQIYALKSFLGREYKRLFCMDVLCYGVMSTNVLRDYIRYVLPSEENIEGIDICFRSKINEVPSFVVSRNEKILHQESFYDTKKGIGKGFGGNFVNRRSCTDCEFQGNKRYSDITVGDYVKQNVKNDYSNSLVMINTEKGKLLFEKLNIKKQALTEEEKIFTLQRVSRKTPFNKKRALFFNIYREQGINNYSVSLWNSKEPTKFIKVCSRIYTRLLKIKNRNDNASV